MSSHSSNSSCHPDYNSALDWAHHKHPHDDSCDCKSSSGDSKPDDSGINWFWVIVIILVLALGAWAYMYYVSPPAQQEISKTVCETQTSKTATSS